MIEGLNDDAFESMKHYDEYLDGLEKRRLERQSKRIIAKAKEVLEDEEEEEERGDGDGLQQDGARAKVELPLPGRVDGGKEGGSGLRDQGQDQDQGQANGVIDLGSVPSSLRLVALTSNDSEETLATPKTDKTLHAIGSVGKDGANPFEDLTVGYCGVGRGTGMLSSFA